MGGDWRTTTLGEFASFQRGHDLPSDDRRPGSVPILGSFGITGWHDTAKANGPGVTVGRSGASFGTTSYTAVDYWPLNTALYVKNFHGNDEKFTYYFLRSIDFKRYNTGSAQPSLNRNHIHPISIAVPCLKLQKTIAHILGTLDEKIELNRQTNETLEAMAQAMFKSWFVDFDPVIDNALAAGNDIPEPFQARAAARQALGDSRKPLPEEIRCEFPDEFVFSDEMGWVPRGWELTKLQELTSEIGSGATPRGGSKVYVDQGVALVRSQNIFDRNFVWSGLARITDDAAEKLKGVSLSIGDILLNITGASILRTCVVDARVLPARVNQHVARIRPSSGVSTWYLHEFLLLTETKELLAALNAGATREAITKSDIQNLQLLVPQSDLMCSYDKSVSSLYEKIAHCAFERTFLEELRDTLLPKLLSGQLTIPNAEKLVAEAL